MNVEMVHEADKKQKKSKEKRRSFIYLNTYVPYRVNM